MQLGAATLVAASLCLSAVWLRPHEPVIVARDYGDTDQISAALWDGKSTRRVYPMSVVPGGVYSAEEAERARRMDPTVAAHYAGINFRSLQRVVLNESIVRFVSFRRGNQVYWTRRPMPIPKGEAVLADGDSMVRSRCGNRLSEEPREPVLPITESQPTAAELEIPLPPELAPPILVASAAPGSEVRDSVPANSVPVSTDLVEVPAVEETEWGSPERDHARPARVASGRTPVPGFGGFNVLGSGLGGRVAFPSQNPALAGNSAAAVLNPNAILPLPAQVLPQLPPPSGILPSYATEGVFAVVTPVGSGGAQTYNVGIPNAPDLASSLGRSSGTSPANIVGDSPFGSRPVGPPPSTPGTPLLYGLLTQISSASMVPPLIPGMPLSPLLTTTPQNRGIFLSSSSGGEGAGSAGAGGTGTGLSSPSTTDSSGSGFTPVETAMPEPRSVLLVVSGLLLFGQIRRARTN